MGYVLKAFLGLSILAGSVTAAAYGIHEFLQIGTCASGGPYVSARECPDDIERLFLVVIGGVIGAFVGTGIFAARGDPPGGAGSRRVSAGVLMWCSIFLGISFACFWGVWGPDADPGPGGKEGGLIVAFLFALMGLAATPMLFSGGKAFSIEGGVKALSGLRSTLERPSPTGAEPAAPTAAPGGVDTATSGGDEVARLERLHSLRAQGAISQDEYERLKKKVMEG